MCALVVTERGHDVVVDAVEDAFEFGEAALAIVGDVIGIATVHRTGDLAVGDLAIVVGVSCAHRAEAFHACHELIDELAAAGMVVGDFAVGCDGSLSQVEVESLSGLKSVELPARLTFSAAQRPHRLGVTPAPAVELRYMVYPWVVDCAAGRRAPPPR
jgi:hypothetical protein